ncbi:MAG TPA: DUF5320 domain-containing protein [Candidatus Paceibacterota bacterium]|nr:DUF5320 domain-containing protein [Candidatus Paceibacterota bacterium]
MPRSDGTGPQGQGPRTGRGMGNCQTCVYCPFANATKEERIKFLKEEVAKLEKE